MTKLKPLLIPLASFIFISGASAALSFADYSWAGWAPATCMPDACFCEAGREGAVRQPANTWSSYAFVLMGLLIISQARWDVARAPDSRASNPVTRQLVYGLIYGGSLVIIGLGSAFYHASLSLAGQFFDVTGMYLLASFILLYNVARRYPLGQTMIAVAYVALNAFLIYLLLEFPALRRYLFAALIAAALGLEYLARRGSNLVIEGRYIRAALLLLVIAFIIWVLDITKLLCSPESWLQGHAVWHVMGALAAGLLYMYYRSENSEPEPA